MATPDVGSDGRSPGDGSVDLKTLLSQGEDMIGRLAETHRSWGLGSAQRWDLDQRTGMITWTFPDRTATAPAQIIGSHNPSTASWLWAWANKSILPEMARESRAEDRAGHHRRSRGADHPGNGLLPRVRAYRHRGHHVRSGHGDFAARRYLDLRDRNRLRSRIWQPM
jgi:hypothetical protein